MLGTSHVREIDFAEIAKLPFSGGLIVLKNKQPQSISVVKWERISRWNVCRGLWDLRGLLPHRIQYYAANCVCLDAIPVLLIEYDWYRLHMK